MFPTCPNCRQQHGEGFLFCPHCHVQTPFGAQKEKEEKSQKRMMFGAAAGLILLVAFFVGLVSSAENRAQRKLNLEAARTQAAAEAAKRAAFDSMTPEQHYKKASELLSKREIFEARRHGAVLSGKLATEFESELNKTEKLIKKEEEQKIAAEFAALAGLRRAYARTLENNFLDNGLNITVEARGKNAEVLHLTWALTSKVAMHQLNKNSDLWESVRKLKFKKVTLTNGFEYSNETWNWNLD